MEANEADGMAKQSWGFAFSLSIALLAIAATFALPGREDEGPPVFVYIVVWLGCSVVWIFLTAFAYRYYGKKWRWFLIGAPVVVHHLTMSLILIFVILYAYVSN
jgi:hypothetical protein